MATFYFAHPNTKLLYHFVQFILVTGSGAAAPTDGKSECTLHHRPKEDMQHLAANTDGPKLDQEEETAVPSCRQPPCCISSSVCSPPTPPILPRLKLCLANS